MTEQIDHGHASDAAGRLMGYIWRDVKNPTRAQELLDAALESAREQGRRDATPELSPMARRVAANKAAGRRTGGERPMGSDGTVTA